MKTEIIYMIYIVIYIISIISKFSSYFKNSVLLPLSIQILFNPFNLTTVEKLSSKRSLYICKRKLCMNRTFIQVDIKMLILILCSVIFYYSLVVILIADADSITIFVFFVMTATNLKTPSVTSLEAEMKNYAPALLEVASFL